MRHLVKGKKLGRTASHRKATLQSLSAALIKEHRIVTTLAKAKALRPFVEPIITRAKEDTTHNRRMVFSKLNDKEAAALVFEDVAQKAMDRPGGYTRIVKLGKRQGDNAKMAVIELVDYNDIKPENKRKKSRTRRSGQSSGSKSSGNETESSKAENEQKAESNEEE